jgi:hypothetical protein
MHSSKETLTVAWCDNGMVDGKFAEGLVYTIVTAYSKNILFNNAMRVQGNQIARQRQALIDKWYDEVKTDWILWVDSDIVAEGEGTGDKFIGEDVSFFRKVKEVGIPVYAHTGATVKHMKRFAFDSNYYNLYWAAVQHAEKQNGDTATSE